ncbi:MAG: AI-2E family transporter [Hyphococcus sp.]|nr:MAG: AI-2E family transporter [Marinicaulis sp.]
MAESANQAGLARTFYGLAIAVLIGLIAYIGRGVLIPLVIAGFLCFLIFMLKENVRRTPFIGKYLPDWFGFLIAFALIGVGAMIFVEIIKSNVETLLAEWPSYELRLRAIINDGLAFVRSNNFIPPELIGSVEQLQQSALDLIRPLLSRMASSLSSITSNFVTFITIFLYLVFMLIERGRIFKKISLLGATDQERRAINETISDIGVLVRQYITVKTVSNLITATISFVIMSFIGIQFAGFWALLIFVLNYIPIFGAASAITLPVLLALVQPDGGGLRMATIALVSLIGAEQVMSNGIEPRLVGRTLNLSPLVILFSLSVWGTLWGFAGLLLSVPITVTVMLILTQFQSTRPIAIMLSDDGKIADIKH